MGKIGPSFSLANVTKALGPVTPEDFAMISDLLETVERNPTSVEAKKVLAQQYTIFGWHEAAADTMRQIVEIQPGEPEATAWLEDHQNSGKPKPSSSLLKSANPADKPEPKVSNNPLHLHELEIGYRTLLSDANAMLQDLLMFQEMNSDRQDSTFAGQIADMKAIAEGRVIAVVKARPPPSARKVAESIKTDDAAVEVAFADLEGIARWSRNQSEAEDSDKTRDAVRKRAEAIKSALPQKFAHVVDTAFMHVEHEVLGKTYQNEGGQTMLGDPIATIERDNFWASEDGYAWDLSELAEAIKANKGVMRNPLSKQMFTADDVRAIVRHKLGQPLAALQLRQQELTRGVRKQTIDRLDEMATIFLDDQSNDATPSREAVENYLTYVALLPEAEQLALDELRVPATDSHTGREFDVTIGEAVADAKANRQCFHKTGDHLRQAARHLRANSSNAKVPGAWD